MVREYTGASSEGATCAWMAADEAVGCTRAFLTMWLSSRRLEHSGSNYKLVTLTLEGAINKITGNPEGNIEQISRLYHSLIQVLFFTQEYVASSVEEENLNVCKTLFKMLENDSIFQEYPETKILWVMTKCWNWGIHKLATDNFKKGQEWCALAMEYLQQLKDLKYLHEERLQALYSSYFGSQTV
ncbi:UNVERIFIED_CONTAM: Testis-expressed protein 11 [Trichonephila clavipes]